MTILELLTIFDILKRCTLEYVGLAINYSTYRGYTSSIGFHEAKRLNVPTMTETEFLLIKKYFE